MRFYSTTFFFDEGEGPLAHGKGHPSDMFCPITLIINDNEFDYAGNTSITFHMKDIDQLARFKASVDFALNKARMEMSQKEEGEGE